MIRLLLLLPFSSSAALAQVVTHEGTSFPERADWVRSDRLYPPDRWVQDGWFCEYAEIVQDEPVHFGEDDFYTRSIAEFAGATDWFMECRVVTDGYPVFVDVAPCVIAASDTTGVWFHFTVGDDEIRFFPDIRFDFVFAEIEPQMPHVYRLEVRPGVYAVWINGGLIAAGVPYAAYPTVHSVIVFGARAAGEKSTTCWDYIRYGVIPEDGSGDFDSDGRVGPSDLPYFVECLTTDAGAWPGCRWADLDGDGDVTVFDIADFIDRFSNPGRDPRPQDRTP